MICGFNLVYEILILILIRLLTLDMIRRLH